MADMKDDLDRRWNDLGDFIREQRAIGELSLRKLSERAGVSNPYLSQIERGLRRPSAEILQQIARALEISAETLYVRAGILDEPSELVDPVSEIRRDPRVTEDQKKTLIHIYESFLRENDLERENELEELAAEVLAGSVPSPDADLLEADASADGESSVLGESTVDGTTEFAETEGTADGEQSAASPDEPAA
ncbi:MAG: helix-turn-helix domain-containing protein [Microthrixaceae bacterium]